MALSGNLLEFGLADILQLISQEKKTGKLVLRYRKDEAFLVLRSGTIVAARIINRDLITILYDYILQIKKCPEEKIRELLNTCRGSARMFAHVLLTIEYISEQELRSVATIMLEDLVSDLFFWTKGNYRFEPLDSVDEYVMSDAALGVEAVSMEAVRRIDELHRMQESFDQNVIFTTVQPGGNYDGSSPMSDPSGYILSLIDNKSTISSVAQRSFFSHYRTFEIIFELWQTGTIVPLSNQQSEQITPLTRAQQGKAHESLQVTIAVIMAILFIAIIMCLGFLRSFLTQPIEQPAILRAHEIKQEQLSQKLKIGSLLYHAKIGYAPANPQVLIKEKILDSHDIIATDSL